MYYRKPLDIHRLLRAWLLAVLGWAFASGLHAEVITGTWSSARFEASGTAAALDVSETTGKVAFPAGPSVSAQKSWRVEVWAFGSPNWEFGSPYGGSPTYNGNPIAGTRLLRWEPAKGGPVTPGLPLPVMPDGVYTLAVLGYTQTGELLSSLNPICRKDTSLNDLVSYDTRYCNFELSTFDNFIGFMRCTNGNCTTYHSIVPETGGWWNPEESGRGFFIEASHGTLVGRFLMYDANGNAVWYLTAGSLTSDGSFTGKLLQYAGGQTLTGDYVAPKVVNDAVGTVSIKFSDSSTGVLTLPNGRQINIQRFKF